MKAAQIVTIKSFSPMFKNDEEATNIHIVNVEEHGFDIVTQKSLYKIGDKALFIQPDYCLSNIPLFNEFIAPQGNPKKSKLGKNNRVRAIKFGFTDSNSNKVYSNGILLPLNELEQYLDYANQVSNASIEEQYDNLDYWLDITKYEEPEGKLQGDSKGNLPSGMYKTDETNFNNNIRSLEKLLPCQLIGTTKIDGSSCTVYWKSEDNYGICSRTMEKKLFEYNYDELSYDNEEEFLQYRPNGNWEEYVLEYQIEELANDDWVQLGYPILEKLMLHKLQYAVRCEIFGQSLKGSGNKKNPHAHLPKSIAVYGIDDYSSSICKPLPMNEVIEICNKLDLPLVPIQFIEVFNTIDELKLTCNNYFKSNLIEGVVIRTYDNVAYSSKFMNNEYDANK